MCIVLPMISHDTLMPAAANSCVAFMSIHFNVIRVAMATQMLD
jgi:hypothetical protein